MRIFVSGFFKADSFAENVFHSLAQMGHEVYGSLENDIDRVFGSAFLRQVERQINYYGPSGAERKLLDQIRGVKPELFISVTQCYSPAFLDELSSIVKLRVIWWGDCVANDTRMTLLSKHWSAVFLKDADAVDKIRIVGIPAFLLDEALNPDWHKPLAHQTNQSVIILGNYYNFRQAITEMLIEHGVQVALYGTSVKWALPIIKKHYTGKYLVKEEKSRIYGAGLACLNSFAFAEGNSLNCRAFEIAGAGGLQLIEYRPAIERCFEPGKEVLPFKTTDELFNLIDRAKKEPQEMKKIRSAGAKRALAQHTYQRRLDEILKIVC